VFLIFFLGIHKKNATDAIILLLGLHT